VLLRQRVRYRDGNACRNCGRRGADGHRLSVHHITPAKYGGADVYENLITLCTKCHARADAAARKQRSTGPRLNWSRHWDGPNGYDERCMRCRKLGKPCEDATP
jgi:5-methylcytosine-specific restriction endonuclease McrA